MSLSESVSSEESENEEEFEDVFSWSNVILRVGTSVATYPFEYVKFLIQIGHEPLPPVPSRTLFNNPALALPNIFRYAGHVRKVDGFLGLYRGLGPSLCGNIIYNFVTFEIEAIYAANKKNPASGIELQPTSSQQSIESKLHEFFVHSNKQILKRCAGIIISHPFQVMALRSMAQFVGKEMKYSGFFSSFGEIYQNEGISGFFAGLIPRVIGEVLTFIVTNSLCLVINSYVLQEEELKYFTSPAISLICSTFTYPFQLVGNIMAVNNADLVATTYPNMIKYTDWTDCWSHLQTLGQLKRGSSLLRRYYTGPTLLHADGSLAPSMTSRFKQSF